MKKHTAKVQERLKETMEKVKTGKGRKNLTKWIKTQGNFKNEHPMNKFIEKSEIAQLIIDICEEEERLKEEIRNRKIRDAP